MLKTLPNIKYTELNQSQVPPITLRGIHGLIAQSQYGPADKPYLIQSVQQFLDTFGSFGAASPFFAQIRRALARGVNLWFQRLVATGATAASVDLDTSLVTVNAVEVGSWANGALKVEYTPTGDGTPAQLKVTYTGNSNRNEIWQGDTLAALIATINAASKLITITTADGFVEPASSVDDPIALSGGTDGTFANTAARDTAVNALFAKFNNVIDIDSIGAMGSYSEDHYGNLLTYVESRQDTMGVFEIDPALTPNNAVAFAETISATPSQYMAVYYGSTLTAYSPEQGAVVAGPILADVQAVWAVSDTVQGNKYSAPAGARRGLIPNVQTFANNMLSAANQTVANQLVSLGVNIVGSDRAYGPVVWGAETFANGDTAFDSINVRRTMTSLREQLSPIFRSEIFQPQDPVSWRDAYTKCKTKLDAMVTDKAIYPGWIYVGDQESSVVSDAKYNTANDLANGKYKVKITVVPIGYISAIDITMIADNLTTLFNDSAAQLA